MQENSARLQPLASPLFIGALALLVLNDFAFKGLFHNWFTGKLSDFAGLFALAIFCATLWPRHRQIVGVGLAAAFAFWKSGSSQPVIDWINSFAPFGIGRTVDPTDLIALPSIWLGLWAAHRVRPWPLPDFARLALALFAPIAFTATSMIPYMVRSTVEIGEPSSAAGPQEAAVQAIFDELAREHGLQCQVCEPLGEGRVYADDATTSLAATFDDATNTVFFELSGRDSRGGRKDTDRLAAEINTALRAQFPELEVIDYVSGRDAFERDATTRVTVTVHLATETLDVGTAESAKRTLSQIVEETVREHDLNIDPTAPIYYAGKRMGVSAWERELVMTTDYRDHATLWVSLTRRGDAYAAVQRALALDLEGRLDAAFGADRVEVTGLATD
jgi:hypothetical protein